jgi:ribokinase
VPGVDICMVGSAMTDLVARVRRLPEPGETLFGSSFTQGFGGKGANQAVMAARLGASVGVVLKLGRDGFGDAVLHNLREQGVDTAFVGLAENRASGVALITVAEDSGENVITIVPGANDTLSARDVGRAADMVRGARVLMAQLETPIPATLAAFRLAKQGETLTLLNPAPAAELPAELLALTDVLIPNELEAASLTGKPVTSADDALTVADALLSFGPKTVVVTLGARGAVLAQAGQEPQHIGTEAVRAVDTTGAGDAFVGSLAYFLACAPELPLPDAVARSCRLASLSVQREGTQTSYPYRNEVSELLI